MSASASNLIPKEFEPDAAAPAPAWRAERQSDALRHFRTLGIPHRRIEEWKYTDLRNALEAEGDETKRPLSPRVDRFAGVGSHYLVLENGRLEAPTSGAPDGIELFDLAEPGAPAWVTRNVGAVLAKGAMGQASLALMRGGVAVRVTREVITPLHLCLRHDAAAVHGRVLIVLEEGASLVLLESQEAERGFSNIGAEIVLGPNAGLIHLRMAEPGAIAVEEIGVRAARGARYRAHFAQAGAQLSRLEVAIALEGEGAEAELSGISVLGGKLHADVTTHVDHVAAKTISRQLFKYVVGGNARGIYQGKISVHKGADGSDSRQTAKALLMGERAEADLKPELEILADDVKCAHGAAVGELDADSLFYLRSRGIEESEARGLLTRAFLEEAIAGIARDDLRHAVSKFAECGLDRVLGGEA
jgi:Fe-S cluster assembly protein SufD